MNTNVDISGLFFEIWPQIITFDISRYLVAASLLSIVLVLFAVPLASRRIQARRATFSDRRREFGNSMITILLFSTVGFMVHLGSQYGIFRLTTDLPPSTSYILVDLVVLILIHDAYFYWVHRWMHSPRLFRRVHRTHHKSKTPTPWAAYSFAPSEAVIEAGILPLVALFMPLHQLTVILFMTHMIVRNVIGHAGIELFPRWWLDAPVLRWITTTTHHDLHHSHGGHNFGLYFTWWDRWMGTEHPHYERSFRQVTAARPVPVDGTHAYSSAEYDSR